ncbi:Cof subfamily protein (haloacid dehalogenase superfamily) [Enterococcus sp. PF1-24]|uniref:Cof-type HAD-IIB family hydrolase n=1 Tax=unclassified Enterococcus TaxID=2608891 RepID=UPI002476469B|nr:MULTISPECIES: Cof-type HAD-IIB family hydrolase [unclassified Enterococcus]MDH6363355.1 Cof subfamily protein (haloacid dehalogenase superfamily) [Enterococcus sp. PFB1-1]MDH6400344.1 Cof subfamily protein (haloacid dehalogenase superfamily) [Enterococcus sp. PF1-24]
MSQLIFMDIDGTLVDATLKISTEDKQAIASAIEKGAKVYVATGRKFSAAKEVIAQLHPEVKVVASNGCVYELAGKRFVDTISNEALLAIYKIAVAEKIPLFFFGLEKTFFTTELPTYFAAEEKARLLAGKEAMLVHIKNEDELLKWADEIVNGIIISEDDYQHLVGIKEKLSTISDLTVSSSHFNNLELIPKDMSKAVAIQKIQEHYQIAKEDTIAFGDGVNDIEMFQASGISVSMGNAPDEVKKVTRFTTLPNTQSGISHFLNNFFKEDRKND